MYNKICLKSNIQIAAIYDMTLKLNCCGLLHIQEVSSKSEREGAKYCVHLTWNINDPNELMKGNLTDIFGGGHYHTHRTHFCDRGHKS